jgi:hypothetical protein
MQDGTQINRIGSARGDQELPAPVDDPAMAEQAAVRPHAYPLPPLA